MDNMSLGEIPQSQDQASTTTPAVNSTANNNQDTLEPGEASGQSITPPVAASVSPVSGSVANPGSQTAAIVPVSGSVTNSVAHQTAPAGAPSTTDPPIRRSSRRVTSQDTMTPRPSHGTSKPSTKGKQPAKGNLQMRCQTPAQRHLQEQRKKDAAALTQSLPIQESFVRGDGAPSSEPSSASRPIHQQQGSSFAVVSASPGNDVQLSEQEKKILAIGKSNDPLASAKEYYLCTVRAELEQSGRKVPARGPSMPRETLELAAGQILALVEQMTPKLEERIKKAEEARREADGDSAKDDSNGAPACGPTIATIAKDQEKGPSVKKEDSITPEEQLLSEIAQSHGKADSDAPAESNTEVGNAIRPRAEVAVVKENIEFGLGPAIVIDATAKGLAAEEMETGAVESLPGSIEIREAETQQLEPGLDVPMAAVESNSDTDAGAAGGARADGDVQMAENNTEVGPSPSNVNAVSEGVPVPEEREPAGAEEPAAESTEAQWAQPQDTGNNFTVATTASIIAGSDITLANILGGADLPEKKGSATTEPRIKIETSDIEELGASMVDNSTEVATREPKIEIKSPSLDVVPRWPTEPRELSPEQAKPSSLELKRKASAVEEEGSSSEQRAARPKEETAVPGQED
ncbi:hypothetical protein V8F06_009403 [Rhypophila decipiens]